MMTTPFPEPESPELERFTVYSRAEIVALLRQMKDEHIALTAYFGDSGACVVTRVLAVKPDFEEVVCAAPATPDERQLLLKGGAMTLVAFLEQVKLQFAVRAAEPVVHEGTVALRVRLPEQVLRLQRRDFYRVRTPQDRPATCLVPWNAESRQYESVRITDISVGGLSMLATPERVTLPQNGLVENCFLDLPGVGSVNVSLQLRHVQGGEGATPGFGCEFADLSPQGRVMLQRYVNRVDAESRRRAGPVNRIGSLVDPVTPIRS